MQELLSMRWRTVPVLLLGLVSSCAGSPVSDIVAARGPAAAPEAAAPADGPAAGIAGPACEVRDSAPSVVTRSDDGLRRRFEAWRRGDSPEIKGVTVELAFCGDLAPIVALGFRAELATVDAARGRVSGVVWFADLARLVEHPGVLALSTGDERETDDGGH